MANWIAKATSKHKGAFSADAKRHGMSTKAFAKANIHAKGTLGKRARLAYTLEGMHGAGKSNAKTPGDKRSLGQKLYQVG
jgi:hypothetical protein